MNLSMSARIGRAVLAKALGLQSNYKTVEYVETDPVLDPAASGCYECPYNKMREFYDYLPDEMKLQVQNCCSSCSHSVYRNNYTTKVTYHNEKAMFGYQPRLKNNAVKVFLILHFMRPGSHGEIMNVNLKKIANLIGCQSRTVLRALDYLSEYSYISYCRGTCAGTVNLIISKYDEYHKPSREGGRGYITLTKEFLEKILSLKNINLLRIVLRVYMKLDQEAQNNDNVSIDISYEDLERYLPDYCNHKNVIKKTLLLMQDLFSVSIFETGVHFSLKSNPHKTIRDNTVAVIKQLQTELPEDVFHAPALSKALHDGGKSLRDCAILAMEYSLSEVKSAIQAATAELDTIINLGGFVRNWLQNYRSFHFLDLSS